jgi:hypothetical protein
MKPIELQTNVDCCIITVKFCRESSPDELELIKENFDNGKITVDPDKDPEGALVAQLCLELQRAFDEHGIAGHFKVESILSKTAFNLN